MLEYCCAVWDPHLHIKTSKNLSLYRHACKLCAKNWSASYSDQLHIVNLPTTHERRLFIKLCTMYKILNNTSFPESIINLRSRFQTHPMSTRCVYKHIYFLLSHKLLHGFFCTSTSTLRNGLPSVITCLSM